MTQMYQSERRSSWLAYLATLVTCLAVIAVSIGMIGRTVAGLLQRTEREKSPVQLQIETAREIRAALEKPIVVEPLPPVTAKPRREPRGVAAEPSISRVSTNGRPAEAMNAMAMEQPGPSEGSVRRYPIPDRHAPQY